jgi:hypothetical protein
MLLVAAVVAGPDVVCCTGRFQACKDDPACGRNAQRPEAPLKGDRTNRRKREKAGAGRMRRWCHSGSFFRWLGK